MESKKQTIDKHFVSACFGKAIGTYDKNAIVQKGVAATLAALMRQADFPRGASIYEVGAGTGIMTAKLYGEFAPRRAVANDLCWGCADTVSRASEGRAEFLLGDAEALPAPEGIDAVVSCSTVHWFENKAAFFMKITDALPSGSFLAFSTFGPGNLREMRELGMVGLEYDSADEYDVMLKKAGFRIIAATDTEERLFFPDTRALLTHIRATGVGGVRHDKWDISATMRFSHAYELRFRDARGLALTYHPLCFVCVKI